MHCTMEKITKVVLGRDRRATNKKNVQLGLGITRRLTQQSSEHLYMYLVRLCHLIRIVKLPFIGYFKGTHKMK